MGKFTNLILIAAAAALILIGVAAQTGSISFAGHSRHTGAISGQTAHKPPAPTNPRYIQSSPPPATVNPQPAAQPPTSTGGDGGDDGD